MIETPRLHLVLATAQTIRCELSHHATLSDALGAVVPETWPPENVRDALEFFAQAAESSSDNLQWGVYYWISNTESPDQRMLVGSGGFFGPPNPQGEVELGYGTLEVFFGRGYATEAVAALAGWAQAQPGVITVLAHAEAQNIASIRVLQKCGFVDVGAGQEPGTQRFHFQGTESV